MGEAVGVLSRPYRKSVHSAGDDVRLGIRALRAAKSHLLSAALSHPCPGPVAERLRAVRVIGIADLIGELLGLATELDLVDLRRKASRRAPKRRAAA